MIKIQHFQSKRGDPTLPVAWPDAEKLLNEALAREADGDPQKVLLGISGYPSALHHNLVVVYDDQKAPG